MASKQDSGSRRSINEHTRKGMRDKIKGVFRHRKNTVIPQPESQVAHSEEGSRQNDLESLQTQRPELSPGNLLDRQESTFATGQERHPPLTQHGYRIATGDGDAKKSEDLWVLAYKALKLRDPDLVAAYERLLAPTTTDLAYLSPSHESIETIVKSKLQEREANQLVINLGQRPVKVREQGEKIIKFILWSNGIVSQALSAQPYAALAWSGVSILLPVSCAMATELS